MSDEWIEHKRSEGESTRLREYRCQTDENAFFGVALRGAELGPESSTALRMEFAKPPHQFWPGDVDAVRSCLGELGNRSVFDIAGVRTSSVGGRDALVVEGRWTLSAYDTYAVLVPVTPDCTLLQEVYFVAPGDVFQRKIQSIKSAIATIRWTAGS
jgi:hypothetical protein